MCRSVSQLRRLCVLHFQFLAQRGCCLISGWALLLQRCSRLSLPAAAHMIVATVSMTAGGESYVIRRPCCLFLYSLMPRNPRDFLLNVIHSNLGLISPQLYEWNSRRKQQQQSSLPCRKLVCTPQYKLGVFFLSVSPSANTHSLSNANRVAREHSLIYVHLVGKGKWLISAFHYFHFWDNHNISCKFNRSQATFLENSIKQEENVNWSANNRPWCVMQTLSMIILYIVRTKS